MITLIHGEDIAASRNFYWESKKNIQDATTINGATITPTDLQQALSGEDLFGTKKPVFIEDLFSKKKSSKDIEEIARLIIDSGADVTLWESKELTPKQTGLFKGANIRVFKIPATIFALLDNVKPGNGKILIHNFHKTLEEKEPEFVLVMLQRQIRILLALCHPGVAATTIGSLKDSIASLQNDNISELSRMQPWQKGKLDKQAKLFTTQQLVQLHNSLFNLELGMKTGGLSLPLADSIDFLLLSI